MLTKQRRGDIGSATQDQIAATQNKGGGGPHHATDLARATPLCEQLREAHVRREQFIKTRIMFANRRRALVAWDLGYKSLDDEEERAKRLAEADKRIASILKGELPDEPITKFVLEMEPAIAAADAQADMLGKAMAKLAKQLAAVDWVERQKGFGLMNFARIIGETGDLSLYANPAKVWKRLGLAPFKGQAPSTWKRKGGLSAEEWTALGYSPRRRGITYVVSECLLKGNGKEGRYRQRYDNAKATFAAKHPDEKPIHCHKHAMLLMVKMLVRDLWVVWNKGEADLDPVQKVA